MKPVYLNDWKAESAEASFDAMAENFELKPKHVRGVNILLASYTYEDYSGKAFVLFEKDGKLFEVNASHCSCNGLENQWEPEETTVEALRMRFNDDSDFGRSYYGEANEFRTELAALLDEMTHTEIRKAA